MTCRGAITFYIEWGSACGCSVVILGFTVVHSCILWEHLNKQQSVVVSFMKELALEARRQSLGVLVPGDLWLGNTSHCDREASWFSSFHRLGLHVLDDLRGLWD